MDRDKKINSIVEGPADRWARVCRGQPTDVLLVEFSRRKFKEDVGKIAELVEKLSPLEEWRGYGGLRRLMG